jgi:hypothetical protein
MGSPVHDPNLALQGADLLLDEKLKSFVWDLAKEGYAPVLSQTKG